MQLCITAPQQFASNDTVTIQYKEQQITCNKSMLIQASHVFHAMLQQDAFSEGISNAIIIEENIEFACIEKCIQLLHGTSIIIENEQVLDFFACLEKVRAKSIVNS